jgi:hypothetical protein
MFLGLEFYCPVILRVKAKSPSQQTTDYVFCGFERFFTPWDSTLSSGVLYIGYQSVGKPYPNGFIALENR